MPGQEKMVMDFYQKNPQALANLRGTVYEEKIIELIKKKAKPNKKELTKEEAEKIIKQHQKQDHDHNHDHPEEKKTESKKETVNLKTVKTVKTVKSKEKKVSNK